MKRAANICLNAFLHIGMVALVLVALTSCMPFHMQESRGLPDQRLRRVYESYRLIDLFYIDKINTRELEQKAVEGMLKAARDQGTSVSPEILKPLDQTRKEDIREEPFQTVAGAFHLIQAQAGANITIQALTAGAIHGMLEMTDPYSVCYSPEEVQMMTGASPATLPRQGSRLRLRVSRQQ